MMDSKLKPADLIPQLKQMDREQTFETLSSYTKAELVELAKVAGITVKGSKDQIAGQITNHFGYGKLRQKMSSRPHGIIS